MITFGKLLLREGTAQVRYQRKDLIPNVGVTQIIPSQEKYAPAEGLF